METDASLATEDQSWIALLAHNQRNIQEIHIEDLILLEKDLIVYEKIALIFLLYGNEPSMIDLAIQNCLLILRSPTNETSTIHQWAKSKQSRDGKWREILVEALCVTQSFHVTDKLGLYKQQLEETYLPYHAGSTLYLNPIIKTLYLMTETMNYSETQRCIEYMSNKGAEYFESGQPVYLEVHLLNWIKASLIKVHSATDIDVKHLYNFIKSADMDDTMAVLQCVMSQNNNNTIPEKVIESFTPSEEKITESDRYLIRRDRCGFVLIINQREFREPNHVPSGCILQNNLKDRRGTDADSARLKATFESRGYKVAEKVNLTHIEVQKELKNFVEASKVYDSLIVCILSHGKEGLIFGSDCIAVKIQTIKEIITSDSILNKPKVLFIQACQGEGKHYATSIRNIETDGITQSEQCKTASRYTDFLTAISTVGGFVSFRDCETGTWFIEEVCKVINQKGNKEHMLDLLTHIISRVSDKRAAAEMCQVPEFSSTLRKKLFLPEKKL